MATNETPDERINELRRQVDDLARRVVLDDPGTWETPSAEPGVARMESVAKTLRVISKTARQSGCPAVADIASELLKGLGGGDRKTALAEGLERLQRALEPAASRPGP